MDIWTMLKQIEKSGDCLIYGILEVQGVAEDLSGWPEFDSSEPMSHLYLMDSHDIPKQLMLDAFQVAYNNTSCEYDSYNNMLEAVGEYIVEELKKKQCVCGTIDCEDAYGCVTHGV